MKKKIFLLLFLVNIFLIFSIDIHAASDFYKTKCTATQADIEVSNKILNTAREKAKLNNSFFNFSAEISEEYELHIYRFKSSKMGFYNFYTLGYTDTLMKVYEVKKSWFSVNYNELDFNDDGCMIGDYNYNSSIRTRFKENTEYLICVRAHGKSTGSYQLFAEPNTDKFTTERYNYSSWNVKEHAIEDEKLHRTCNYKKVYLTKEQVILLYWILCTDDYNTKIKDSNGNELCLEDMFKYYYKDVDKAISIGNTIISIVCSAFNADRKISLSLTLLGVLVDAAYKNATKTRTEIKHILEEKCSCSVTPEYQYWDNGQFYETRKYSAENELCVIYKVIYSQGETTLNVYSILYEGYNNRIREGYEYDKGTWSN